jgi:hypothetical protein
LLAGHRPPLDKPLAVETSRNQFSSCFVENHRKVNGSLLMEKFVERPDPARGQFIESPAF